MKPIVDGLEEQTKESLLVIRLNIQESIGRELGAVYGFGYTPTFIFFDAQGNELWRSVGELDLQKVFESLR